MIWWLSLGLSLIPFNFGLVYLWRRKDGSPASVAVTEKLTIEGPVGFVVFALGLAGCALSIYNLLPPSLLTDPPTGHVRAVERVAPRNDRARVRVRMDDDRIDVHNGDYMVALARNAPRRLPVALGNLDSDTTALLRVSAVAPGDVKATLDSFAAEEAAVAAEEAAVAGVRPVWPKQRVVLIDHNEKVARDQVRQAVEDAGFAPLALRHHYLRRVVDRADDFLWDHSSGFFAAEVLLAKGEAHHKVGEIDAAIAAYERFQDRFHAHPAAARMPQRIAYLRGHGEHAEPPATTMTLAAFTAPAAGVVPASAIAVRASSVLPPRGRVDYDAANLLDGDPGTAWSEGSPGSGIGVTIRFRFARALDVDAIRLRNGYAKSSGLFGANGSVTRLRVRTERRTITVRVRDTPGPQTLRLPAGRTRTVELRILDVRAGRFPNTMLSEIEFLA